MLRDACAARVLFKAIFIRRIIQITIIAFACHFFLPCVQGQVKFYMQVSESIVSPRQTFQVQYIIEGTKDIGHFTLPVFTDFRVEEIFEIPVTPTINPQNSEVVDTYSKIVILSPRSTGRFTLPGATASVDGKTIRSNTATVTVQQTGLSSAGRYDDIDTEAASELVEGEDVEARIKRNFFLRVEANKTSCFVGEPIMVVYKAYSRLHANSQVVRRPSLTGFSVLEMVDGYDNKPEIEILNGLPFYTNIIRKVQLFPLQEGDFVLDAAEIESVIHFMKVERRLGDNKEGLRKLLHGQGKNDNSNQTSRTPFDYRISLASEPVIIQVKSLPAANQPPGFSGAVGNFSLAVQTPSTSIREGDLVKIKLVVNGSGNISLLTAPKIEWPVGVDTAEPIVKETINKYVYPATGSKTFEYTFAAPDTGNYTIPAAHLPYYDPVQKVYKIATSNPVTLHVSPGIKAGVDTLNIDADTRSVSDSRYLYWFAVVVLIIVGWLTWQAVHLRKTKPASKPNAAIPEEKNNAAIKQPVAEDPLFKAQWALERGKSQLFYRELEQALWQVIAAKYQVLPSALNKYNALHHLQEKGVDAQVINDFSSVLDEVEWALYTPDQSTHDMDKLFQKAREIVKNIEQGTI